MLVVRSAQLPDPAARGAGPVQEVLPCRLPISRPSSPRRCPPRAARGLSLLRTPSREAVRTAIDQLDPFHVSIARNGLEATRRKMTPVGTWLEVTRPLERVEIDEGQIDLITLMTTTGLMDLLDEEDRLRLGLDGTKQRWWLSVAICAATRCILAMRLADGGLNLKRLTGAEARLAGARGGQPTRRMARLSVSDGTPDVAVRTAAGSWRRRQLEHLRQAWCVSNRGPASRNRVLYLRWFAAWLTRP